MNVERSRRSTDQHFLIQKFHDSTPRGHVADARLFGDFPLTGNTIKQLVTWAKAPFDQEHHFRLFRLRRHRSAAPAKAVDWRLFLSSTSAKLHERRIDCVLRPAATSNGQRA